MYAFCFPSKIGHEIFVFIDKKRGEKECQQKKRDSAVGEYDIPTILRENCLLDCVTWPMVYGFPYFEFYEMKWMKW